MPGKPQAQIPFGSIIHVYRLAVPLTPEQLAERMAMKPEVIKAWEEGTMRPNIMQVPLLCASLGISYEDFFGVSKSAKKRKRKQYYQLTFAPVLSNHVIASVRAKRNMSLEDFAEKVGISTEDAALIESGKKIPKLDQIPVICKVLGIRIRRFFE